jgi:hypothetical protein
MVQQTQRSHKRAYDDVSQQESDLIKTAEFVKQD